MDISKIIRDNQKTALDLNNSIWVSAFAGSGKTTILTKRLLKLLISDVDISKIVCITYTKTGANEMKQRIYKELSNWILLTDEELEKELKKLFSKDFIEKNLLNKARILFARVIDNLDELKILTIHSFCQQILRKFPIEAGVLPNFEIMEENTSNDLINKATNYFLNNLDKYPNFIDKIKKISRIKNEEQFYDLIKKLISKQTDLTYIQQFNSDYKKELYKIFDLTYGDNCDDCLKQFISKVPDATSFLNSVKDHLTEKQQEKFCSLLDYFDFNSQVDLERYLRIFLNADFSIGVSKSEKARLEKVGTEYVNFFTSEQERCYNFWQKLHSLKIVDLSIASIEITLEILKIYQNLKAEKYLLDYDDLIIYTYKLLTNTEYSAWINYKLDSGMDNILLDEAQDTSKIQWLLINALTEEFFAGDDGIERKESRSIFVVGDEKQSIFKFQGANIDMFNNMFTFYRDVIYDAHKFFEKVDLNYSFRSLPAILGFVDKIFESEENKNSISKLSNEIKHNCYRVNENQGYIEVWPLTSSTKIEKIDSNKDWELDFTQEIENENKQKLAQQIAQKIKFIVDNKKVISVKGVKRNVKYNDIMILSRTRDSVFISYLIRNLNKNNVPCSGSDEMNLTEEIVIQDFISLFNVIVFPNDDLSLANIIKSPILNLTENDLLELCIFKKNNKLTLFETINSNEKYKETAFILNDIIQKSKVLSIYDLCLYILNSFGIKERIVDRFSEHIYEIINQFLLIIKNFEDKNTSSIISFLQNFKSREIKIKKDLDHNINQVRIMTVHGSKGLQSPIVFVIGSKGYSSKDASDSLCWLEKVEEYKLPIFRIACDKFKEISENIIKSAYDEYLRLLYVALTRSENELYICGWLNGNEREDNNKDVGKKGWHQICLETIKKIGIEKQSYLNDSKTIFYYGDELGYFKVEEETKNLFFDDENVKNILNNIKVFSNKDLSKKIINPSQFYKHTDRDNNLDNLDNAIIKGNAVHKLLEILPECPINERNEISDIYLNNLFYTLNDEEKKLIKEKVFEVLDKYSIFYNKNSKSEVPIIGEIDGEIISGQIDRLIVEDDKIIIIDYKNTLKNYKNKEDLPYNFHKQLELYSKLISRIYPDKKIECYILLTSYLNLIKIF